MLRTLFFIAASLILVPTAQAGDVAKGEKIFKRCMSCHMVGDGAKARIGPQLNNLFNRGVATVEGYNYSKGMQSFGAEHKSWTPELLSTYLENPRNVVKGTIMSFGGLRKESDRDDVIAYLQQFNK
jgi:cytochrome c2